MPHKQFVEEPAPNKYFKTPSEKEERRMKYLKKNPEQRSEEDDEKFKLYVDRRKIDKKVYKPLKTAVYQAFRSLSVLKYLSVNHNAFF